MEKAKNQRAQLPKLPVKKKSTLIENSLGAFQKTIPQVNDWLKSIGVLSGTLEIPVTGLIPVPPLIHFIWIGPLGTTTPIKAEYVANIRKMAVLNPGYRVWVWTDVPERVPDIDNVTKKYVTDSLGALTETLADESTANSLNRAIDGEWTLTKNFAAVSDILRLLILYKHGGVYCDTDNEPLRPFPSPMLAFGMRVGLSGDRGAVTNALMASTVEFRFFHYLARRIASNWDMLITHFGTHRKYSEAFLEHKSKNTSICNSVVNDLSGPLCLNLLMDATKVGNMNLTDGFLVPWRGFGIPKEYVHVGSDQNWLQ